VVNSRNPRSQASRAQLPVHFERLIGEPHLRLIDAGGYWCFIYNDKTAGIFETYNIYTMRLNGFPLCDWVAEGHGFVAAIKKRFQ